MKTLRLRDYFKEKLLMGAIACAVVAAVASPLLLITQVNIHNTLQTIEKLHVDTIHLERIVTAFTQSDITAKEYLIKSALGNLSDRSYYITTFNKNLNSVDVYTKELINNRYVDRLDVYELQQIKQEKIKVFQATLQIRFLTQDKNIASLLLQDRQLIAKVEQEANQIRVLIRQKQYKSIHYLNSLLARRLALSATLSGAIASTILLIAWRNKQLLIKHHADACEIKVMQNARAERARVIGAIAHDLRLCLQPILTASELIQHYGNTRPDRLKTWVAQIPKGTNRIKDLADDLILVCQSETNQIRLDIQEVDLPELVNTIASEYSQSTEIHELIVRALGEPQIIRIDPDFCDRAIRNLISNAVKYSPKGGMIYILVDLQAWSVSVGDKGIGIPENIGNTVFEAFQRADNVGAVEGVGLGLSVVKACAIAHGGSVSVASPGFIQQMEFNTVFTLKLKP